MFEKVSRSLKYDSNIFFVHKHIQYIYMDTTVDHFTPLALRVRGNKCSLVCRTCVGTSMLHRLQLPRIIRDSHENIAYQSATHGITPGLLSATELILGKLRAPFWEFLGGGCYFVGCELDP